MAKKIKQKKSGMIRRQQKKRQQKKIRRRLSMPSRGQNNLESPEKLEQLLSALSKLAFEPELNDLRMNESELKSLIENNISEIEIFIKLIKDAFVLDLSSRLAQLVELNPTKSMKSILSKATIHHIENKEKITLITNPLIIAIFLKTKSSLEGKDLNPGNIETEIEAFNGRNQEFLNNLPENIKDTKIDHTNLEKNVSSKINKPIIEKSVLKKFLELFPKEKQIQIEDDLDVFLEDFEPPPIDKWDLNLVKNFLEVWFVENANPMEEDIKSMQETLLSLFQFLCEKNLIQKDFLEEVLKFLKK